jgi:hypothetical protein
MARRFLNMRLLVLHAPTSSEYERLSLDENQPGCVHGLFGPFLDINGPMLFKQRLVANLFGARLDSDKYAAPHPTSSTDKRQADPGVALDVLDRPGSRLPAPIRLRHPRWADHRACPASAPESMALEVP